MPTKYVPRKKRDLNRESLTMVRLFLEEIGEDGQVHDMRYLKALLARLPAIPQNTLKTANISYSTAEVLTQMARDYLGGAYRVLDTGPAGPNSLTAGTSGTARYWLQDTRNNDTVPIANDAGTVEGWLWQMAEKHPELLQDQQAISTTVDNPAHAIPRMPPIVEAPAPDTMPEADRHNWFKAITTK